MEEQKRKTWIPAKNREDDRRGSCEEDTEPSFCQRMTEPLQFSTPVPDLIGDLIREGIQCLCLRSRAISSRCFSPLPAGDGRGEEARELNPRQKPRK